MTHRAWSWRQVGIRVHLRVYRAVAIALGAALAAGAAGCTEPEDDEVVVIDETSHALASSLDLVGISDGFRASELLASMPVALARPRMLLDVRAALMASVVNRLCMRVDAVDSATETYVEVTYESCPSGPLGLLEIDGSLRADLAFETAPCGTAECPTAVRITLSTEYLRMGSRLGPRFAELAGSWELYDPLEAGLPTEWESGYTVRNHLAHSLTMSSRASWAVADGCTTLDVDAMLAVQQRADLRTIAASAEGVVRCLDECPSAGTVRIAYGLGKILSWEYTGANTAVVTGPRGRTFEVALPCGEE